MSIRSLIKRIVALALLIIVGFLLQTAVFPSFKLAGVTPNIIIIITSMIGFMRGRNDGMVVGFLGGLFLDSFYPTFFGMHALIYLFLGYVNGVLGKLFYGDDVKFPMMLVGLSDVLYGLIMYTFMFMARGKTNISFYFTKIIIPEMMYTILVSIILFYPIFIIDGWIRSDDKRSMNIV